METRQRARLRSLSIARWWRRAFRAAVASGATCVLAGLPWRGARATERPFAVVDLHVDLPYQHVFKGMPFGAGLGQFRAPELEAAGLVGVLFPLFVPTSSASGGPRAEDYERPYGILFARILETPPYSLPGCGVRQAGPGVARQVQSWLAFEGAAHLEPTRRDVASWMVRGVRSFGLVHTRHNALATSSSEPVGTRGGLSERGRRLLDILHELGGVVDVSHASDEATNEILQSAERARSVVIASHSNARARAAHPRNLTDDQIRGIARTGGVVGINFHQPFLVSNGRAGLRQVVEHVRHVVRVAGIDHVAVGSDFEGGIRPVPELQSAARYQVLAQALLDSGLSRDDVRKVLSENALRVLCASRGFSSSPVR